MVKIISVFTCDSNTHILKRLCLYCLTWIVYILHFNHTYAVDPIPVRNCQYSYPGKLQYYRKQTTFDNEMSSENVIFYLFRPISWNNLTSIDTFSCGGGITHPTVMSKIQPVFGPASDKDFFLVKWVAPSPRSASGQCTTTAL